jgi:SAM-dependent methyltransferase
MRKEWIKYLCCPECGADLTADAVEAIITNGVLQCTKTEEHTFPILDGIPRFVEISNSRNSRKDATANNFAYQWNKFDKGWVNDEASMQEFLGSEKLSGFRGKVILDAGCGMGRFSSIAAKHGAKLVIGMDIGDSIIAAQRYNRRNDNVFCIQGDIYKPPIKNKVDMVYSLGVIHHLPSAEQAFKSLYKIVKPSGKLVVWVYGAENNQWLVKYLDPIRVNITSKLPMTVLYPIAATMAFFLWLLLRLVYKPAFRFLPRLSKSLFYADYFQHMVNEPLHQNVHTILDHLLPPFSHYISKSTLSSWIAGVGAKSKIENLRNYSWTAIVQKS